MAFVFDSTVGGTSSNSYLTVAEADDYFDSFLFSDEWSSSVNETKEKLLVMSTRLLDLEQFISFKNTETQSLQWPRLEVVNREGDLYNVTTIPEGIKNATAELAYELLINSQRYYDEGDADNGIESMSIGGSLSISYKKAVNADQLPKLVKQHLKLLGPSVWKHKGISRSLAM